MQPIGLFNFEIPFAIVITFEKAQPVYSMNTFIYLLQVFFTKPSCDGEEHGVQKRIPYSGDPYR